MYDYEELAILAYNRTVYAAYIDLEPQLQLLASDLSRKKPLPVARTINGVRFTIDYADRHRAYWDARWSSPAKK